MSDDFNCDGELIATTNYGFPAPIPVFACNGLTHDTDTSPLYPCQREYPRKEPNQ